MSYGISIFSTFLPVYFSEHRNQSSDFEVIQDWVTVINTSTSVTWLNFNLEHKDIVKTTLKTTNGALNEITNTTDGLTVDLTPPKLNYIRDGLSAADISYQVIITYNAWF